MLYFLRTFVEEGRSIHALSHLDPCFPPSERIHAFYGKNTLAFSSLREFGRFYKGTGMVRQSNPTLEELTESTQMLNKPLMVLQSARK